MSADITSAPPEGADAWLAVSDAILRGLNHALSNRIATVSAVVAVIDPDDTSDLEGDRAMLVALAEEIAKLEEVLNLLRMVPRHTTVSENPVRLSDLLPATIAAHEHHPELRDIPCELDCNPDLEPVLLREVALAHAMLSLLCAAKLAVVERGAGGVRVRCAGDARRLTVLVEAVDGAELPGGEYRAAPLMHDAAIALEAARWSLAGTDGEVGTPAPAGGAFAAWSITLPSLSERRRAE